MRKKLLLIPFVLILLFLSRETAYASEDITLPSGIKSSELEKVIDAFI